MICFGRKGKKKQKRKKERKEALQSNRLLVLKWVKRASKHHGSQAPHTPGRICIPPSLPTSLCSTGSACPLGSPWGSAVLALSISITAELNEFPLSADPEEQAAALGGGLAALGGSVCLRHVPTQRFVRPCRVCPGELLACCTAKMGDMLPQESTGPCRAGSRLWQRSVARFRVLNAHFIYLE